MPRPSREQYDALQVLSIKELSNRRGSFLTRRCLKVVSILHLAQRVIAAETMSVMKSLSALILDFALTVQLQIGQQSVTAT
jgi:hypothetical protein